MNKEQEQLWNTLKNGKCQRCKTDPGEPKHSCPYAEDVDNDIEYRCNCCDSCESICLQDI